MTAQWPAADMSAATQEAELHERLESLWAPVPGWRGVLGTVDHKTIGKRYLVTALVFLVLGGVEALVMRLQLIAPEASVVPPETYNQLFTLHGTTMILWYAAPILSGFGNFLIPLFLGSRDMAFPRLNAFSYWMFLFSGVLLYSCIFVRQAPDAGWFAYVPLSNAPFSPGYNMDFYNVANVALTISTTAGAINFIVTIFKHRAPGMTPSKTPLFAYSTGTTSFLVVVALPALTVANLFLELDRRWGTHFFDLSHGGEPLVWQHVFWFFGHPWVYVVFLPATGMISMILPTLCRRPIVGHKYVAAATVMTGVVGLSVWVHHMFAVGVAHGAMTFFSAASMTISVFSTIQVFAWLATLRFGRPVVTTALLFTVGFIASFLFGGLSGVITAVIPFDWQVHDTYFVVGHLHYVLIGANVFPVFAGFYHWFPKMTGRLLDERLGRASFWLMFGGFHLGFFPMHLSGLLGMRRRVYTYTLDDGLGIVNLLTTIGAIILGVGILVSLINFFWAYWRGAIAGPDPWRGESLEWLTSSPPSSYNFARIPTVKTSSPLWDAHDELDDPRDERTLAEGRRTVSTSVIDAEPESISEGAKDTPVPIFVAATITLLLTFLMLRWVIAAACLALLVLLLAAVWLWPEAEPEPHEVGP